MIKLEILSNPGSKEVLKLRPAKMTSSSKISEKVKIPELEMISNAPSNSAIHLNIFSYDILLLQKSSIKMFSIISPIMVPSYQRKKTRNTKS